MIDATAEQSKPYIWWAALLQGIFSVIFGVLLLTYPKATLIIVVQFIGIYWLVVGIFSLVGIIIDRRLWGLKLVAGILGVLAGIAVMQHPLVSAVLLPTFLIIFLGIDGLVIGFTYLVAAFRGGGLAIGILGLFSVLIGILLLSSPVAAAMALPWVFGVLSLMGGLLTILAVLLAPKS